MMKQRILNIAALALFLAGMNSCLKTDPNNSFDQGISATVKAKIAALGFDADEAYVADGGYIVENDIFLTDKDLNDPNLMVHNNLLIANSEQYRTTNLVSAPRTITVSMSGNYNTNMSTALDNCIARYNALHLGITFSRVSSSGNINIKTVNGGSYIASSGFPSSSGNPYPEVKYNRQYRNWNNATVTSVIAHEIGHCIGFRHTDYMDRSYSCGGSPTNEGDGGVGAIHIPGTPTGPDAASWMLSCIGNGIDRPFNPNDVTALNYLYQ